VFEVPLTVGVNVVLLPSLSDALLGVKLTVTTGGVEGGIRVTVEFADFVESATLVAVTVTVCWLAMVEGAV
jgi:hypothetical protein